MKDLEKEIEEAALVYAKNDKTPTDYFCDETLETCWISGAKSLEAKEYWQVGMYSEKEVWEFIRACLKATGSNINATMHNIGANAYIEFNGDELKEWFEQNKKK